jgi:hypothetical protein
VINLLSRRTFSPLTRLAFPANGRGKLAVELFIRHRHLLPVLIAVVLVKLLSATDVGAGTRVRLTPRLSLEEQYDDNIALVPDEKDSDWITTVSPGLLFEVDSRKTRFDLDYEAGFAIYLKDSDRDTDRHRLRFLWDQKLTSHLSFQLTNTFRRSEDPITTEGGRIVDIAQGREVEYRNFGRAKTSWQFGVENQVTAGYRNYLLKSDADFREDSTSNQGFLDLSTWFMPQLGLGLKFNFSRWQFQQPSDFSDTPTTDFYQYSAGLTMNYRWRPRQMIYARYDILYQDFDNHVGTNSEDYLVHQPTLGLSLRLGRNTEFGAEAGYFRREREDGHGEDGFAGSARFTAQGKRVTYRLESDAGYFIDYGSSQNRGFSKFSDTSGHVDYQFTENLGLYASARYRWADFTEIDRTDKTWGGKAGLVYTLQPWLAISLEGGYLKRDSNERRFDFTDNRVTFRITGAYPWQIKGLRRQEREAGNHNP